MSDDITGDLDLLDDWLAGKGYGEEAGLVLRALSLIHKQAREIEKLRAALKPFAELAPIVDAYGERLGVKLAAKDITEETIRAAAAALKEASKENGDLT